jgi:hypothetical protein
VAFILKEADRRKLTSPLTAAPLDRARDMLSLAQMGDMASQCAWNDYAEQDPRNARTFREE